MPSKWKTFRLVLFCLLSVGLIQCSFFFDKKEEVKVVKMDREHLGMEGCLDQSEQVFTDYMENFDATDGLDHNVKELSACYNEMMTLFIKHTKSGTPNSQSLSAVQVKGVLDRIYSGHNFTQESIEQAMAYKAFFVGGSKSKLTYSEISKLRDLFDEIGEGFLSLRPHRAALFNYGSLERTAESATKIKKGVETLESSVLKLYSSVAKVDAGKRTLDLEAFGGFLLTFSGEETRASHYDDLRAFLSFKRFILNQDHNKLSIKDLRFFIEQMTKTYWSFTEFEQLVKDDVLFESIGSLGTFFTRAQALLEGHEVLRTETLLAVERILLRTLGSVRKSVSASKDKKLGDDKLKDVIQGLELTGVIGKTISAKTLYDFLTGLIKDWLLDPQYEGAGLSRGKVDDLRGLVENWMNRMKFINEAYQDHDYRTVPHLQNSKEQGDVYSWLQVMEKVKLKNWSEDDRLYFSSPSFHAELAKGMNYRDAVLASTIYTQLQFFTRRYQKPGTPPHEYVLTKAQLQEAYGFLRTLGLELKIMDPRMFNTGERAFMEANNFTTQRNNDDVADLGELFELLSIMYSSDRISQQVYEGVPDNCKEDHNDVLGKNLMEVECFREFTREKFFSYFTQLGGLYQQWTETPENKEVFFSMLEKAAREGVIHEREISMGDIRVMVSITYYLQSIFFNFDLDRDGIITGDELPEVQDHFQKIVLDFINTLFPTFRETFKSSRRAAIGTWFTEAKTPERYFDREGPRIALGYILENRKVPDLEEDNLVQWVLIGSYRSNWVKYEAEVSTLDGLAVFSVMGDSQRTSGVKALRELFKEKAVLLRNELNLAENGQTPTCPKEASSFCTLAEKANCSIDAYPDLFRWMHQNQSEIFDGQDDPVKYLSRQLNEDKFFSTQCIFPYVGNL